VETVAGVKIPREGQVIAKTPDLDTNSQPGA
jgi:hypothetical protein